ncbi:hypothetical protein ACFVJ5_15765 [Nocardia sp. NPDC127606]|uniref:hypothetical protein n=1 Tax=Nocardia sp. NPDC127606 TaxID=3345406 RepID=UPI003635B9A4
MIYRTATSTSTPVTVLTPAPMHGSGWDDVDSTIKAIENGEQAMGVYAGPGGQIIVAAPGDVSDGRIGGTPVTVLPSGRMA